MVSQPRHQHAMHNRLHFMVSITNHAAAISAAAAVVAGHRRFVLLATSWPCVATIAATASALAAGELMVVRWLTPAGG